MSRRAIAAALAAAALLSARPAAQAQSGVTFTYRVQSTAAARDARSGNAPSPNMIATVRMSGGNARMDFREGSMPMTRNGGYVLIRGADRQLVFVNPQDKQAMVIAADNLGAGLGSLTNNALVKMTVRDPRFSFEELGAGEPILGYPTRRVRTRSGSTTEMRILGRTQRSSESSETEMWIATRPAGLDASALEAWSRSFGSGLRRTNPGLAAQMADYQRKYGDGLALRAVTVTQMTDEQGKATTDTTRMEVTELSRANVPASLFEVPSDYQVVDTRQLAAAADSARRASGDTTSMSDAAKAGAADAARAGAADAAKNAIGGLFRRKRP